MYYGAIITQCNLISCTMPNTPQNKKVKRWRVILHNQKGTNCNMTIKLQLTDRSSILPNILLFTLADKSTIKKIIEKNKGIIFWYSIVTIISTLQCNLISMTLIL